MIPTKLEFLTELSIGTETKAYTQGPNDHFYRLDNRNGCEGVWVCRKGAIPYFVAQSSLGVPFKTRVNARAWIMADAFKD